VATIGCSSFQHGYTTAAYQGPLLVASEGPGAERLQIEAGFDSALNTYVGDKGNPDHIFVASDAIVTFCSASNRANRLAMVYLSVPGGGLKPYSCELDKWGEWLQSEEVESST
jgi:hypothetical protein